MTNEMLLSRFNNSDRRRRQTESKIDWLTDRESCEEVCELITDHYRQLKASQK